MELTFKTVKRTRVQFLSKAPSFDGEPLVLADGGCPVRPSGAYVLPAGEACKHWDELGRVLLFLSKQRVSRSQRLVAVGGGAALDFAALTASLYRRGLPLALVPTTLLAMVDATLGGKTAIDGPEGIKNFAGTFYPADEVWIFPGFLASLPIEQRISGAGEVWKTLWLGGKTADASLVEYVKSGAVTPGLKSLIRFCLEFKRRVVAKDPLDTKRVREQLNFGHTVGHALEALAAGRLSHGECVLWGMAVESSGKMRERAIGAIRSVGLELPGEFSFSANKWIEFMQADKKMKGDKMELTTLSAPGRLVRKKLSPAALGEAITEFGKSFRAIGPHA